MTQEGVNWKEMCQWTIKSQYKGKVVTKDVAVVVELYFADKRRRDVDNFNKIILDSCTGLLWKDDSQIIELTIRKFRDKKPRVELFIL
jgi:crossover junction endodeoxyribonuclease RusA